jgi:hypothetical protein
LGVSQNESVHPKLESQPNSDENPESQQTLAKGVEKKLKPLVITVLDACGCVKSTPAQEGSS